VKGVAGGNRSAGEWNELGEDFKDRVIVRSVNEVHIRRRLQGVVRLPRCETVCGEQNFAEHLWEGKSRIEKLEILWIK